MDTPGVIIREPLKALIVDDEADICFLLSGILRQKNVKPSFVNNLESAKQSLQQEIPSILFLDNHLPDGFGLDFIPYVKKEYPDVKIIMITAHDGLAERKKAQAEGADLFISKPFSREVIDYAIIKSIIIPNSFTTLFFSTDRGKKYTNNSNDKNALRFFLPFNYFFISLIAATANSGRHFT